MYDLPKPTIAADMKNDITQVSEIKIKLVSRDFFNMENLSAISIFLDTNRLRISSIDMGIDRVIKFISYINIYDILQNYEIPRILRAWINLDTTKMTLRSILTEDELNFLDLHFEMFYQIETFATTNTLFVRI